MDQNKWIDLARAHHGRPRGGDYEEVLDLIRTAVDCGRIILPLSAGHYMETWERSEPNSRHRLAHTMWALSEGRTLADHKSLLEMQIDYALRRWFGHPTDPRAPSIFGFGVNHAFGLPIIDYEAPEEFEGALPEGFEESVESWLEMKAIFGPNEHVSSADLDLEPAWSKAEDYIETEHQVEDLVEEEGKQRLTDILIASEYMDIRNVLNESFRRAGIPPGRLLDQGKERMKEFLKELPTRWIVFQLRRVRHTHRHQGWECSDLEDIHFLSRASVYCDVVVTEKEWEHHLSDCEPNLDTIFLSELQDLKTHGLI